LSPAKRLSLGTDRSTEEAAPEIRVGTLDARITSSCRPAVRVPGWVRLATFRRRRPEGNR